MPRRTNLWQEMIAVIAAKMAGDVEVIESAMLPDRRTGAKREVDVVIKSRLGNPFPRELIVSVEATSPVRPCTVEYVERMIAKHADLPTNQLILVSKSGFTVEAQTKANSYGVALFSPQTFSATDSEFQIVNKLESLHPRIMNVQVKGARVAVQRPDGSTTWFFASQQHIVFTESGDELDTFEQFCYAEVKRSWPKLGDAINLHEIGEPSRREVLFSTGPWRISAPDSPLCAIFRPTLTSMEFHPILGVQFAASVDIEPYEVPLTHMRLGEFNVAYGKGSLNGKTMILVAVENEQGGSIVFRPLVRPR
ncbi:hypothetical protein GCM10017673_36090 [Streptosporangium violaceochromogenes]|nr:hypothetical protein GCM10017673_36090 [Streptosporangium violaceochromogenes]